MGNDNGTTKSDQKRNKIGDYLGQAGLVVLGALLGAFFTGIIVYGEVKEEFAKNRTMIDANKVQIDRLWDAHDIGHETAGGGE